MNFAFNISIITQVITYYRSNFGHLAFLSHPLGAWDNVRRYDVYLELIGKRVVDFLLVLLNFFRYVLRLRRYGRK